MSNNKPMQLINKNELPLHKFLMPCVHTVARGNGKTTQMLNQVYQKGWNDAIDAIVDNAHVVEERTKGEWESVNFTEDYHDAKFKCSKCDTIYNYTDFCSIARDSGCFPNYCPNCGAYMKGEEYD